MRNITLSAADTLIDQAREKAKAKGVTLNDEFRQWLARSLLPSDPRTCNVLSRHMEDLQL